MRETFQKWREGRGATLYFFIDDVVSDDADRIFQFLSSCFAPPPVVAGHHFREYFTERVVSLLQRSRLGVQTEIESALSSELFEDLVLVPVKFVDIVAKV